MSSAPQPSTTLTHRGAVVAKPVVATPSSKIVAHPKVVARPVRSKLVPTPGKVVSPIKAPRAVPVRARPVKVLPAKNHPRRPVRALTAPQSEPKEQKKKEDKKPDHKKNDDCVRPPKPKPKPQPGCCVRECCPKVAFIGLSGDVLDLQGVQPYIVAAQKPYPVKDLKFAYVESVGNEPLTGVDILAEPPVSAEEALAIAQGAADEALEYFGSEIQPRVLEVHTLVTGFIAQGFTYISVPPQSLQLAPFLRGTYSYSAPAENFVDLWDGDFSNPDLYVTVTLPIEDSNNLPLPPSDVRYPGVTLMVTNAGTGAVEEVGNIVRFFDVDTFNSDEIVVINFEQNGLVGNPCAHIVFGTTPGTIGSLFTPYYVSVAESLGVAYTAEDILGGPEYVESDLTAYVQTLLDTLADLEAQNCENPLVVAALATGGSALESNSLTASLNAALATAGATDEQLSHIKIFPVNYGPDSVAAVIEGLKALSPDPGLPTQFTGAVGLPQNYCDFIQVTSGFQIAYLEAYVWAATCGQSTGVLGSPLKFRGNSTVSYWLAESYVPANELIPKSTGFFTLNGRWSGQDEIQYDCIDYGWTPEVVPPPEEEVLDA